MAEPLEIVVIALGGNAISVAGEEGNIEQQFAQSRKTARVLADVIVRGFLPVITHGNGPQVGNILRRVEIASDELYTIPLEVCVADTQAGMGYMIGQCLMNELAARGMPRHVTTIVTTVRVDAEDPAFRTPTKPIGPPMRREVAEAHADQDGWTIRQSVNGEYRRIVPSPRPQEILEFSTIQHLVAQQELVICCGGGGIPVTLDAGGQYAGVPAVIDKDHTTSLLARQLRARTLVMLTSVEQVCLNFGHEDQRPLSLIQYREAGQRLAEGHFEVGSMRPKIEAALDFVSGSTQADAVAIVAHLDQLSNALAGSAGTRIIA